MIAKVKKIWWLKNKIRFLKYSRSRIEAYQLRKLKVIVTHAYNTVPYYHDLFSRHHVKPEDIQRLDDLRKIPLTSKKDIVDLDRSKITSDAVPIADTYELRTSGSTGEPFVFLSPKNYGEQIGLDCLRSKFIHGMKPTDRVLRLGGLDTICEKPKRVFLRRATLSSFSEPAECLAFYNRFRPKVMRGYVSIFYVLALWIEEHNIKLDHTPRFVLCSGEVAHDFMKEKIARVFRTRVIDRYATAELGVVANSCDQGLGYHVHEDTVLPEIIPIGSIPYFVGTNLDNFATPFIRYNTGDICEPWPDDGCGRCACGLNTRKFTRITGRSNDFIRKPDGRWLSPIQFIYFMRKYYDVVQQYRFIQEDEQSIRTEIVPLNGFDSAIAEEMTAGLKVLTDGLQPRIHLVDRIALEKSGKMRIIRSMITSRSAHAD